MRVPKPDKNGVRWYGHQSLQEEDPLCCIQEVYRDEGRRTSFGQCLNPRGHGPEGLFCKTHIPLDDRETTTWWYLSRHHQLEEVEVQKETPCFIWVNGRQEKKVTDWGSYFSSEQKAREALKKRLNIKLGLAEEKVQSLSRAIEQNQILLHALERLEEE